MSDQDVPAGPSPELTVDDRGSVSPLIAAIDETVDAQRDLELQLRSEFKVNNTDFRALLLIFRRRRRGESAYAMDLTRGLGVSSGAASQIVNRLREAGLLDRTRDPVDARAGSLDLSEMASRRLATSTDALRQDLDRIIGSLDATEEERIIDLLAQVRTVFADHGRLRRQGPAA